MSRAPLSPPFADRPFLASDAIAAGIGRRRLQGADLARPFPGVRSAGEVSGPAAYLPRLRPTERFSHLTALALWGAPLPSGPHPVHVTSADVGRPRIAGVIGHRGPEAAVLLAGVRVSSPVDAFCESAGLLGREDLVAVADHLVLDPHVIDPRVERPLVELDALRSLLDARSGRGIRAAREAAALARAGVESARETRLRLALQDAGLPDAECGFELRDDRGRRVGWFDLAWPTYRVIAEYDGDQHRTSTAQYERDIARFDAASDLGWRVFRVRAHGLGPGRLHTIDRVRGALRNRGWSPSGQ